MSIVLCGWKCTVIMFSVVDRSVLWGSAMKITSDANFISDIALYGMLSAIDGKSKPIYLVYGDEVFRQSGPPEYMSPNCADESGAPGQLQEQSHGQDTEEYAGATETE